MMGPDRSHLNRAITGTATVVLLLSLVIGLFPFPPKTHAHPLSKQGTVGQEITYARPVKYPHCVRMGDLYPSGYGCLQWVTRTRMENCPGPGPGCSVINQYTRITCSGYWVGRSCREPVRHRHATTTTTTRPPTTTTTRPPTTTTRPATTTTRRPPATRPTTRVTQPPATHPRSTTTTTRRPPTTRPRIRVTPPPTPRRPTTTTTRRPTTTTLPPNPTHCQPLSESDLEVVRDRFGWGTVLGRPPGIDSGVAGGDEVPVGKESARLFITSNKLLESAAAEPRIWPLVPAGVAVESQGTVEGKPTTIDCRWDLQSVRSQWRELLAWRPTDRPQLRKAAPDLVEQWERMGESQRRAVQNRHRSAGVTNPTDVVCEVGQQEETDCVFFVSHPSVWEWTLWATFRTADGDTPQERTLLVGGGVSRLQRLVDYTSSTAKVCAGEDC